MKAIALALAVVSTLLGYLLYQKGMSAGQQIETLLKDQQTLSNQVSEVRTRWALELGTAANTVSNLQHALDQRTAATLTLSNRLVQTHLLLQTAQSQAREAQQEVVARATRVAALEAEGQELARRAEGLAATRSEVDSLRKSIIEGTRERNLLEREIGRLKVELAGAAGRLMDPQFLRSQLEKVEEEADVRERLASGRMGARSDRRLKLEWMPDGTVRYAIPPPSSP